MTNEGNFMEFKDRLKLVIERSGETIIAFSRAGGVAKNTLHNYLNGSQPPKAQFLERIKRKYPWINLNWLLTGEGVSFTDDKKVFAGSTLGLQHDNIIWEFDDKDFALEINQALMSMEKVSLKEFYKLGGYIKALSESGIEIRTEPSRLQYQQNDSDVWDGSERRSGKDRRKSVSVELPPAQKK